MARRIEDYALLGDTETVALVGADASIDWLCLPRIDSDACFAALLGGPEHGRWSLAPVGRYRTSRRCYRGDSLVLETELTCAAGTVRIVDAMPLRTRHPVLVRLVEGVRGRVRMRSDLVPRFGYGRYTPWIRSSAGRLRIVAGPDTVLVDGDVDHEVRDGRCVAEFEVGADDRVGFRLVWTGLDALEAPDRLDATAAIRDTEQWWREWSGRCRYDGQYRDAVVRSLVTVEGLRYAPSGGIAAAATTSLPEHPGGERNWDYRFCWIRDATFSLLAFLDAGYDAEAQEWREWLLRALAGQPEQMQTVYRVDGSRSLDATELPWLPGFDGSRPVRAGNIASGQFQLDVYGELMDSLHQARAHGIPPDDDAWAVQKRLIDLLESRWRDPDNGLWEMQGDRRHFTHSKVMAWVGLDRAIRTVERFGADGPVKRWKALRQHIFDDVCEHGYDPERGTFTQYYGSTEVDASLLLVALVGFLPPDDPRVLGTVAAIERELGNDGLVCRYRTGRGGDRRGPDGLEPGEGAFLPCCFWLADNYVLQGRTDDARALFERLLDLRNDVGLLPEEYDTAARRWVGNVPQTLSHVAMVNTARNLSGHEGPAHRRSRGHGSVAREPGAPRVVTPRDKAAVRDGKQDGNGRRGEHDGVARTGGPDRRATATGRGRDGAGAA